MGDLQFFNADCPDENIKSKVLLRAQEVERLLQVKNPISGANPEFPCRKWVAIEVALKEFNISFNRSKVLNTLSQQNGKSGKLYMKVLVNSKRDLGIPLATIDDAHKKLCVKFCPQLVAKAMELVEKRKESMQCGTAGELCAALFSLASSQKVKVSKTELLEIADDFPEHFDYLVKSFQCADSNSEASERRVEEVSPNLQHSFIKPAAVKSYFGAKPVTFSSPPIMTTAMKPTLPIPKSEVKCPLAIEVKRRKLNKHVDSIIFDMNVNMDQKEKEMEKVPVEAPSSGMDSITRKDILRYAAYRQWKEEFLSSKSTDVLPT